MPILATHQTPEQQELSRRQLQLSALRAALVERERALAALRAQLHSFEGRYIRQVGVLYKQLDEWEQKIAELDSPLLLPEDFGTPEPQPDDLTVDSSPRSEDAQPALDLKALFRELAKRIHPDFSTGQADAEHRTRLMAEANDAFRRKDADMLQRMLHGHDGTDYHDPASDKLARILAQLERVEQDILRIEAETEALTHSELAGLQQRTIAAAAKGQDLLAEMAARVKGNIGMAMRRYELDFERRKRKQPAFDPSSLLSAEAAPSLSEIASAAPAMASNPHAR